MADDAAATVSTDDLLYELSAKQAINDCLVRYCRGIDRGDRELIRSAYHPDGLDDHGSFVGTGWDFADLAVDFVNGLKRIHHYMQNTLIVLGDGEADVESSLVAMHVSEDEKWIDLYNSRYLDHFELRDGEWKIQNRVLVVDGTFGFEAPAASPDVWADTDKARHDKSDPSYTFPLLASLSNAG
jgi:SnoaL-like domain